MRSDGGPAFPAPASSSYGMSLRDYFAAQALIGLLASREGRPTRTAAQVAFDAYDIADAMQARRVELP